MIYQSHAGYIPQTWAFLAHYPSVEIVQISIEDNFAKRPKTNMSVPVNICHKNNTKVVKRI